MSSSMAASFLYHVVRDREYIQSEFVEIFFWIRCQSSIVRKFCSVLETIRTSAMRVVHIPVQTEETQRLRIKIVLCCPICALNLKIKRANFCRKQNCQIINVPFARPHVQQSSLRHSSAHVHHERLSQENRIHPLHPQYPSSRAKSALPSGPIERQQNMTLFFHFIVKIKRHPLRSRSTESPFSINELAYVSAALFDSRKICLHQSLLISSRPGSTTQQPPHKLIHNTTQKNSMLIALDFPSTFNPVD